MKRLLRRWRAIANHPLNRSNRFAAAARLLRWQAGSRILPGPAVIPFTRQTRLLVQRGMTGATGNVYCGLHDFEDMCFLLHFLRHEDTFVDVGANVGTYTVLASGEAGAKSICIEPIPQTYQHLLDNIYLNRLDSRVNAHNFGVGDCERVVHFTSDKDTTNHVVEQPKNIAGTIAINIRTLDGVLQGESANLIKVDVEGFEHEVIEGSHQTLSSESLCALLIELNGSGRRYGYDDDAVHGRLTEFGFTPHIYDPLNRRLASIPGRNPSARNTLYVRNKDFVVERLATAEPIVMPRRAI